MSSYVPHFPAMQLKKLLAGLEIIIALNHQVKIPSRTFLQELCFSTKKKAIYIEGAKVLQ